jgi:hypothetical protein
VTPPASDETPAWLAEAAAWLTPRRLRAQAILLAVCLWGVCAIDFATPGLYDRAGNIKFQDFLPLYVSSRMIAQGRAGELYEQGTVAAETRSAIHQIDTSRSPRAVLPNLYGPQVSLLLVPLARLSFLAAAGIWVILSLLAFFVCRSLVWKSCLSLRGHAGFVAISAAAFPPLFHFFVRGQLSVLLLACFTAAYLAFRADRNWLAGIALGFLVFKPQFLIAIPLVLLLARAWTTVAGIVISSAAQLAATWLYFGPAVMRAYFDTLRHTSRWMGAVELSLAPIQMHSLRSFWTLLIPWPGAALALYFVSSIAVIAMAASVWKSSSPIALRFSALTLAAVLVNPHLFVYDLLVLVPVLLLLADWILTNPAHPDGAAATLLSYLAFVLPLLGPLSQWTHVQLSVPVFVALLWTLRRVARFATPGHKLASHESSIV